MYILWLLLTFVCACCVIWYDCWDLFVCCLTVRGLLWLFYCWLFDYCLLVVLLRFGWFWFYLIIWCLFDLLVVVFVFLVCFGVGCFVYVVINFITVLGLLLVLMNLLFDSLLWVLIDFDILVIFVDTYALCLLVESGFAFWCVWFTGIACLPNGVLVLYVWLLFLFVVAWFCGVWILIFVA